MQSYANKFPFAPALSAPQSIAGFKVTRPNQIPWSSRSWRSIKCEARIPQPAEPLSIYAVDDHPGLTELYSGFLAAVGYVVRTFNQRADALAALKTDHNKPALLITDYLGVSMPVSPFIHACRSVHPSLRILMASGYDEHAMQFCRVRPDRFIQKPFTPEELQQTVRAVLADS